MFRNYLITALRNLLRNPLYAFINVFGLSIGITCSLVILLFIKHEFSYDRFHVRKDLIYRVVFENVSPERMVKSPQFTDPVGPAMVEEFPEINDIAGHNEFSNKACPCFNVKRWWNEC